jgi:dipeptidyl aminopeptidase/acylaminoacyl peptidase
VIGMRAGRVPGRFRLLACSCAAFVALAPGIARAHVVGPAVAAVARMTYIAPAPGSGTDVILANADGSGARTLGAASTAVLSPSGTLVAAVRPRAGAAHGSALVVYSTGARTVTRILRTSTSQLTILAWSPDGSWIAVADGDSLVAVPLRGAPVVVATGTINGASFAPAPPDRLVFAKAGSVLASAPVNLYMVALGAGRRALEITHDGLSEFPLWGPAGIVFSRELSHSSPTYQLWSILPSGRGAKQLTSLTLSAPFYGLEPIAFSADGKHLLANLVGDNATQAWTVDLSAVPAAAHELGGTTTIGNAISRDGAVVLLTQGDSSASQSVAMVPWSGGAATTLAAHGAFASWNR